MKVVDATAAGNAFTGALAVARAEGLTPDKSLTFANAAGALACIAAGAQPALPTREAVNRLVMTRNKAHKVVRARARARV